MEHRVSDTTLRARRDEWIAAGVFEQLNTEALAAFDRIVGLDLTEVSVDGSRHKASHGGEGTGPNPQIAPSWAGSGRSHPKPIGWATDAANRNDMCLDEPTLDAAADAGLLADIDTLHLDRGYDYPVVRSRLAATYGLNDLVIQPRRSKQLGKKPPVRLGLRWIEATNTWVVQQRPAPPQHRPANPPPPRRPLPRHHHHHHPHHRPPHRPPHPMEPSLSTNPLKSSGRSR